jgi:putative transposase
MQLVEQHVIDKTDPRFAAIDRAAFASKNLYNAALYEQRQAFIFRGEYLCYEALYHRMKGHEAYQALPRKVSQQVLKQLEYHLNISGPDKPIIWLKPAVLKEMV